MQLTFIARLVPILAMLLSSLPAVSGGLDLSVPVIAGREVVADEGEAAPMPPPRLRPPYAIPEDPDWDGLKKDTYYFVFSQFFVIGALYAMPESISGWSDEQKEDYSFSSWRENVSEPLIWDGDRWWINYVLHPYWGGAYYVRAKERGYGEDEAFWYSVVLSTMFEFGAEALFEIPSVQDMIVTPGIGFFVGKYFMHLRNQLRDDLEAGHELRFRDRALLLATDPLGSANRVIDRIFGIEGDYRFSPFMTAAPAQSSLHPFDDRDRPPAVARAEYAVVPGLHLSMRW